MAPGEEGHDQIRSLLRVVARQLDAHLSTPHPDDDPHSPGVYIMLMLMLVRDPALLAVGWWCQSDIVQHSTPHHTTAAPPPTALYCVLTKLLLQLNFVTTHTHIHRYARWRRPRVFPARSQLVEFIRGFAFKQLLFSRLSFQPSTSP